MHKQLTESPATAMSRKSLQVRLAQTESEVRAAQRLRYKVFAEELGAKLATRIPGHDVDYLDRYCEHLIVQDTANGKIVGTYRILPPNRARKIGGYYSEHEFYLTRLQNLRNATVEIGRACIHPDYRSGGVIVMLWAGLADYMVRSGHEYLIGCASITMADGGNNAANTYLELAQQHLAPIEYQVFPIHRLPFERLVDGQQPCVPALLKGYLRAGAWICGEPAWDPDFNCADILLLLPIARLASRYSRHFIGDKTSLAAAVA